MSATLAPGAPYNQVFNRPLAGFEGQPVSWLKIALALGDDIHHTTSDDIAPGFPVTYSKLRSDTTLTFLSSPADPLTFRFTRNTQPAFSSPSVYDDTVYDLAGKHVFGQHWSAGAGIKLYNGDWFPPVLRNDWVYTASALLGYTPDPHLSIELAYSFDWTDCEVAQLSSVAGREYTRNLVWLALRYIF